MDVQEKLYTASDLWDFSHKAGDKKHYELVRGVILETAPTGELHGEVASELNMLIRLHVKQNKLGRVTAAETGYILETDPYTIRAPDVGFVSNDRAQEPISEGYVPVAPDLAVEVVSPGDTATDIQDKVREYLSAGTQLVWVVYPKSRTVNVHRREGSWTLESGDTLDGASVLPGFKGQVADLFPGS
jgi:Uma2 family endonuclease